MEAVAAHVVEFENTACGCVYCDIDATIYQNIKPVRATVLPKIAFTIWGISDTTLTE